MQVSRFAILTLLATTTWGIGSCSGTHTGSPGGPGPRDAELPQPSRDEAHAQLIIEDGLELCTGPVPQATWAEIRRQHWRVVPTGTTLTVQPAMASMGSHTGEVGAVQAAPAPLQFGVSVVPDQELLSTDVEADLEMSVVEGRNRWDESVPGQELLLGTARFELSGLAPWTVFEIVLRVEAEEGGDFRVDLASSRWLAYLCAKDGLSCSWRVPLYACEHPNGVRTRTLIDLEEGQIDFELFRLSQPDAPLTRVVSATGSVNGVAIETNAYFSLLYAINHPFGSVEGYAVLATSDEAPFFAVVVENVGEDADAPVTARTVDSAFRELSPLTVTSTQQLSTD